MSDERPEGLSEQEQRALRLARDIGNVQTVSERRSDPDAEHRAMVARLSHWRGEALWVAAALREQSTALARLRDWQCTVTAALSRPGGAHYEDVPHHVRALRLRADTADAALEAQTQEVTRLREERDRLRTFTQHVYDKFSRDEAQGYHTKDRQYAIDMLGKALSSPSASEKSPNSKR